MYIDRIAVKPAKTDHYADRLPAIKSIKKNGLRLSRPIAFFVGENGSGKSTLLEAMAVACGFNPEGGTRNFSFATKDTHSPLAEQLIIARTESPKNGFFLRAESFYNAASYINEIFADELNARLDTPYGDRSLHARSHGESFLALVQHRFDRKGLYLLDEPEAALSPARQLTLLAELKRLEDAGAQIVIATHSPILTAYPGAEIFSFSARGIEIVSYRETDCYAVTKRFLDDPDSILRYLFEK